MFVAFVVFSSNDQAAVACSSERVPGGGEMRPLLVICGACCTAVASGDEPFVGFSY